jgi:protein TonB
LGRAQIAFAAGRLSEPRGDNALDYYRAVLAMDAQHRNAQAGIQSVVAALEQKVDVALRARNASQTLAALKVLERAQPSHPRLATAHAELLALSKPRRPATTPLVQPAAAPPPVKAEATPHLDAAIALIAAGQLVTPSNDNAFAHLRLARDAQQNDTRVRIAATDLGARLLQRAAQALKSGDADLAREMLDAARLVDDEFQLHLPEMEKVTREVIGAPVANETLLQELATALHYRERDQLIEPAGANAYDAVIALRQRYPQLDAVRSEQQRLAITLLERTRTAIAAREIDTAATLLQRADTLVPGMSATRGLSQQIAIARGERDAAPKVLQAMDLPRVSEVAAQYPTEVEREGREGWVDVDFTIAVDGSTEDLVVREASPAGIFDQAALDALRQWRFEPILNAGTPVKQRATIRVKFALQ